MPNERPHMTSYKWLLATMSLSGPVSEIQPIKNWMTLDCPFKVIKGQRSWCQLQCHIWFIMDYWPLCPYLVRFPRYSLSKIEWPWIVLWRSSKVKGLAAKWKATYDFLWMTIDHDVPIWSTFWDIVYWKLNDHRLSFKGRWRSKVSMANERPHRTSYKWLLTKMSLSGQVSEI